VTKLSNPAKQFKWSYYLVLGKRFTYWYWIM